MGINDPQRVVGYYKDTASTPHDHGFFFDKKSYTTIDVPGAVDTRLLGLNNPGDMVGYYTDSNDQKHGFLYSKSGAITTIDAQIPGVTVTDTICEAINSSGTIVGEYIDDQGKCHGFVYLAGVFVPVDAPGTPGAVGTFIEGINDNGEVTAFSTIAFLGTAQ